MTLNRGSKLVRFAYYFADYGVPSQTSLCRFFWRAFVFVPLFWLLISTFISIVIFALYATTIATKGLLPLVLFGITGIVYLLSTYSDVIKNSVFIQGIKAMLEPYCPIIEIR